MCKHALILFMNIYILGNGGYAQELYDQFFVQDNNNFGGFITLKDDKALLINNDGVIPFDYRKEAKFMLGTGVKTWRSKFLEHFLNKYIPSEEHFPNFFSNRAYISKAITIGYGNIFNPFSLVNGTSRIGNFNCINIYASISHDCTIGDNNIFSPYSSILGYCKLGNNNFLSANCTITPRKKLGDNNTISAGECVFDDMSDREFFQSGVIYKKP